MATLTLRPTSATGDSWLNTANVYDGSTSTAGTVSVTSNNCENRFLTCNFDTSVIPSGATINSATLTVIAKQSATISARKITPRVDINGDSNKRVIEQQLTSTSSTTLTADVSSYMSDLTFLSITPYSSTSRTGTFTLYEVYIDVDYSIKQTYTVNFKDYNGDVLDTQEVIEGGSATPPSDPNRDGYRFIGWQGDYTNITANIDITAQYIKTYNIAAFAGIGGTISPNGTTTINEGGSQSYTVSSNTEYRVKDIIVDGVSQGAITSYTFSNVISNHTIEAVFEVIPTYTINITCGDNGTTNPSGTITVHENENVSIVITADIRYEIDKIIRDGIESSGNNQKTMIIEFTNVVTNHTLVVSFKGAPTVVAAIEINKMHSIGLIEGEANMSLDINGLHIVEIYEDLIEGESMYLDENGILHVYEFLEDLE